MDSRYITAAKITATHGLKGEVKIYPIISPPELLQQIKSLYCPTEDNGVWIKVKQIRAHSKGLWLLSSDRWQSIEDVEGLKGQSLYILEEQLPQLPSDSYYIGDLIGCSVKTADDRIVGELTDVLERGAHDLYVIKTVDQQELLLPAVKEFILSVDTSKKIITVVIPQGLREL